MAVVNMPVGAVWKRRAWVPPSRNQVNESGWTGARTVLRLPGAGLWRVSATHVPLTREVDMWPWKAFFSVLEGPANTFLMPTGPQWVAPGASGTPTVYYDDGAVKGSNSFKVHNLATVGLCARGGQHLSVTLPSGKHQLFILVNDVVANEVGLAQVVVRGVLRETLLHNSPVQLRHPVCEMALINGDVGWDVDEGVWSPAFDAREAFGR